MSKSPVPGSSTLLVNRLLVCPGDAEAWDLFVRRYSGPIYQWCRRHRLQDADAQDVTQTVFAALLRRLQTFDRSRGRFRGWLYRVVQNCVRDWHANPAQHHERGTQGVRVLLASEPARRDLEERLNEEFDREALEAAEMTVRLLVTSHCWDAYQLCCKQGLAPRHASEKLGIPAGHASKYALRVRDMVARQIALVEGVPDREDDRPTEERDAKLPAAGELGEVPAGQVEPRRGQGPNRARSALPNL
jgi:RNA polymerase sigma-70 factor (ECF subfamily)